MKITKKVKNCEEIPPFYAPYAYSYSENAAKCTFIGLNLFFYFWVEFRHAFKMFTGMSAKAHNERVVR